MYLVLVANWNLVFGKVLGTEGTTDWWSPVCKTQCYTGCHVRKKLEKWRQKGFYYTSQKKKFEDSLLIKFSNFNLTILLDGTCNIILYVNNNCNYEVLLNYLSLISEESTIFSPLYIFKLTFKISCQWISPQFGLTVKRLLSWSHAVHVVPVAKFINLIWSSARN